ncbi:MAG: hypothetical protein KJ058_07570, partial [Thermoanaerobaculia bacterium]|nr:hypothetical protein [Thermoanaerobaculia bacterium]
AGRRPPGGRRGPGPPRGGGPPHAEIAAATGVAAGSVRVLLFRARQKLAALLAPAAGPSSPGAPR